MCRKLLYILITAVLAAGCEKPYNPVVSSNNLNILVVEGIINTGSDSTVIKLSRTTAVGSKTQANPETKAVVSIEDAQSSIYTLTEKTNGTYVAPPLNLNNTKQYRVRIKTSNGKTYVSDLVVAKVSPPIDSVGFTIKSNGMQVYANTHDAANNTRYYRYTYRETWQFHSRFSTSFISDGNHHLAYRTQDEQVYNCFGTDSSSTVIINSTVSLSQDIAYQFPVAFVDNAAEKPEIRYSILVSQQALTKEGYTYWDNLEKNTEKLGSIFDAQPTQLTGNIHNIADSSEPVIGFISAGTVQQKRIFINNSQLPSTWLPADPYNCKIDTGYDESFLALIPPTEIGLGMALNPNGSSNGTWFSTPAPCADCTTRGVVKAPSFWIY